jgi:heme/copper-type cytochrome/quinol oxidase subunit 1
MRYFRRLPPLLRVASILGLLFSLASIVTLISALYTSLQTFPESPPDFRHVVGIGINLTMLGAACSSAVNIYNRRFRKPDRGHSPLSTWQRQVWAIVLLAALPSFALALALFAPIIPPVSFYPLPGTFDLMLLLSAAITPLGAVVLAVA